MKKWEKKMREKRSETTKKKKKTAKLTTPDTPSSLSPTRYVRNALANVMVISGIGALYMYRSHAVVATPATSPRAAPPTASRTNCTKADDTVVGSPSSGCPAEALDASTTTRRSTKKST